ncbi:MAG TPA: ABC transporter permease [Saprospiraceae bacterium]|nr:ABC transporter permease [Saprospiraceae bacterium]MCC6688664.1 ABC transporter permease [Saprospiraceae bacterium]HMW74165.1 ABC transporter permease [Saprospiraceae bacterium]HMX82323.1 ABC transporter permease [Saprospiraceae bacterium]HMX84699.1 ABC transporter permease [Saprospiraceae bacterium]
MNKQAITFKSMPFNMKVAVGFISLVLLFAIAGRFIANDVPIYYSHKDWKGFPAMNKTSFLAFKQKNEDVEPDFQILPLIPYSATSIDYKHSLSKPGQDVGSRHLLGTDTFNRDVLAGIIYGSRTALLIGILSNILAVIFGLFLGSLSGYYSSVGVVTGRQNFIFLLMIEILLGYGLLYNPYVSVYIYNTQVRLLLFFILTILSVYMLLRPQRKNFRLDIDLLITKSVEIFQSVPGLLLLLGISAVTGTMDVVKLTLLVSLLRWPGITRLVRGEVIKVRQSQFIESAKSLGVTDWRVIAKHILPNITRQIIVAFAFGVASSILLEASLSFLGLGLPPDQVTWGMLLSQSRTNPAAWWLAIFPGLMISLLILACYTVGNYLNNRTGETSSKEEII